MFPGKLRGRQFRSWEEENGVLQKKGNVKSRNMGGRRTIPIVY